MTIKSIGTFLCDHFLIDSNGKTSLIGIFKRFNVKKLPATISRFFIVSFAHADGINNGNTKIVTVNFKISGPDGKEVNQKLPTLPLRFSSENKDASIAIELNGFNFNKMGIYEFNLFIEDKLIDKTELSILLKE